MMGLSMVRGHRDTRDRPAPPPFTLPPFGTTGIKTNAQPQTDAQAHSDPQSEARPVQSHESSNPQPQINQPIAESRNACASQSESGIASAPSSAKDNVGSQPIDHPTQALLLRELQAMEERILAAIDAQFQVLARRIDDRPIEVFLYMPGLD